MGHAQFLSKLIDYGLGIQGAIDLPRLFPLSGMATIEMEGSLRQSAGDYFTARGFKVQPPNWAIGGAQAIWIDWPSADLDSSFRKETE